MRSASDGACLVARCGGVVAVALGVDRAVARFGQLRLGGDELGLGGRVLVVVIGDGRFQLADASRRLLGRGPHLGVVALVLGELGLELGDTGGGIVELAHDVGPGQAQLLALGFALRKRGFELDDPLARLVELRGDGIAL